MTVTIELNTTNPLEAASTKIALEKIAKNFDASNINKVAELSSIPNANKKIQDLFNNPLFKMAIK